jgi:hypothetical protein
MRQKKPHSPKNLLTVPTFLCSCLPPCLPILLFSYTSLAHAASLYVDSAVSIAGNGTSWSSAWTRLSDIDWSSVNAGDTIYISGGLSGQVYYEPLSVGASGHLGSPITITKGSDPGHDGVVTIDGQNSEANGITISEKNNIVIRGLDVRNHTNAGIYVSGATEGVAVEDNDIYTGNARGIIADGNRGPAPLLVHNNRITTPTDSSAQTDGIWTSNNDGGIFDGNTIVISNNNTNGHSDGIQSYLDYYITIRANFIIQKNFAETDNHGMWLSNTRSGGIIKVYNNVVITSNLSQDSAVTHWAEPSWNEDGSACFWNNTIFGGRRSLNLDKTPRTRVYNNILWPSTGGYGVYMVNGNLSPNSVNNNLIWAPGASISNIANDWRDWELFGYDLSGINADPGFIDPANDDFRLQSSSGAIDMGMLVAEVGTDIAGITRPQGVAYDIGAYEAK